MMSLLLLIVLPRLQVDEVREKVEAGELMVKAAYYDITSGVVDILSDDGFMD